MIQRDDAAVGTAALTVGLVLAITLNAFEALAVVAALPSVAADLHGDSLYGAVFVAYMLAVVLSIVVSGVLADRFGPARPFGIGLVTFTIGLVGAATAPTMAVVVASRALQGFGGGSLAGIAYVGIARGYPAEARPRLFAILSTAWVVPGILAPPLAGFVAEHFGWRWVFAGLLPFIPLLTLLTLPALHRLGPPTNAQHEPRRSARALQLAVGAGMVVTGFDTKQVVLAVTLVVAGATIAIPALSRLLPPGALRAAHGLPAAVLARGLLNAAFFGTDAFIPFAADRVHGASRLIAGLSITSATLTWTLGSVVQARHTGEWSPRSVIRAGFLFVAAGVLLTSPVVSPSTPVGLAFLTWAVAGVGMGLGYNSTSVVAMAQAEPGTEGRASSQLQIADALGFALASGVSGAIVAAGDRAGRSPGSSLTLVFATMFVVAVAGFAVAGRAGRRVSASVAAAPAGG